MPDTVYITSGTNTPVATDYVNINGITAHVQYLKLVDGTANSTSVIPGDSTFGLDVDVTRLPSLNINSGTFSITGFTPTITANLGTIGSAATESTLSSIYSLTTSISGSINTISGKLDTIDASISDVNTTLGGTISVNGTVTANIGTIGSIATEATLSSISGHVNEIESILTDIKASVQTLDNAVAGSEYQVDIVASLPAGTNNIGDVDVLSVPAPLSTAGGGTEAAALRVTIASDSTGVLSVDDNGSSLTIDGTVTANLGTIGGIATESTLSSISGHVNDIETILADIKTAVQTLDNAVAGSEFQVDLVGSIPAGTSLIGSVNVNGGSITVTGGEVTVVPNASWPVYQTTHDSLNCNANMQWQNLDVDISNPLPVEILGAAAQYRDGETGVGVITGYAMMWLETGSTFRSVSTDYPMPIQGNIGITSSVLVYQTTHDALNCNSNIQWSNTDVDLGNPLPIDIISALPAGNNNIGNVDIVTAPGLLVTGGTIVCTKNSVSRTSVLVSGVNATLISAPGASAYLKIHNISMSSHGGPIRFSIKDGSGGSTIGEYTLAESGGGFKDDFMTTLSANTALYYTYVSSQYNPSVSINISYQIV